MGEIETISGHRFHALLDLCVEDSCEHYDTIVYVIGKNDDGTEYIDKHMQSQPDFFVWVALMKAAIPGFEIFPYKYRYRDTSLRALDHHVGDDGWSKGI
jgi:hypothetical protein